MASITMLVYALDSKRPVPYAPPLPRVPDSALPEVRDTVTYRRKGKEYRGTVMAVTVGDFDEPEYLLDTGDKVLKYSIMSVSAVRMVA